MDPIKNFAANLRALRAIHELSREQLAKKLKVHPMSIRQWESGTHAPKIDNAIKVAEYFKVKFLTLYDYNVLIASLDA
jgi:DNA-binding XRE family transcriptional regulator